MGVILEYFKDFLEFRNNRTALRAFREEKGRIFAFELKRLEDAARHHHESRTAKNRERIEELERQSQELSILTNREGSRNWSGRAASWLSPESA